MTFAKHAIASTYDLLRYTRLSYYYYYYHYYQCTELIQVNLEPVIMGIH